MLQQPAPRVRDQAYAPTRSRSSLARRGRRVCPRRVRRRLGLRAVTGRADGFGDPGHPPGERHPNGNQVVYHPAFGDQHAIAHGNDTTDADAHGDGNSIGDCDPVTIANAIAHRHTHCRRDTNAARHAGDQRL